MGEWIPERPRDGPQLIMWANCHLERQLLKKEDKKRKRESDLQKKDLIRLVYKVQQFSFHLRLVHIYLNDSDMLIYLLCCFFFVNDVYCLFIVWFGFYLGLGWLLLTSSSGFARRNFEINQAFTSIVMDYLPSGENLRSLVQRCHRNCTVHRPKKNKKKNKNGALWDAGIKTAE